jgi:hypothetical protein
MKHGRLDGFKTLKRFFLQGYWNLSQRLQLEVNVATPTKIARSFALVSLLFHPISSLLQIFLEQCHHLSFLLQQFSKTGHWLGYPIQSLVVISISEWKLLLYRNSAKEIHLRHCLYPWKVMHLQKVGKLLFNFFVCPSDWVMCWTRTRLSAH